ncbi:MAG: hypothetical protein H6Q73_1907 [Firmicutes bacterium]|nr:hypothetical protein [Bacillota bacterium]
MNKELVVLRNVNKRYGDKLILEDVNLSIVDNQVLSVVGANGCGKSTLLKIIAGLCALSSGTRQVDKTGDTLRIGYVPERFPKLPFTVMEYLFHMGKIQGLAKAHIERLANELCDSFNFSAAMKKIRLSNLSKGSLQKVAVMQAIMIKPHLLIMDEPLSGQDVKSQELFIELLRDFKKSGTAMVLACHEQYLVERIADRVVLVEDQKVSSCSKQAKERFRIICFKAEEQRQITSLERIAGVRRIFTKEGLAVVHVDEVACNLILTRIIAMGLVVESVNAAAE